MVDALRVRPEAGGARPRLSVVAPCYNEAGGIDMLHRRLTAACRQAVGDAFELVLVDDGSRDATWSEIAAASDRDPHVVGVRLARNHGHQLAVTAGLALTRGERVMLIDADLQDPPELLPAMMRLMDEGADVVYGRRRKRHQETWFKRASAAAFYRLLQHLSEVTIPVDTGDFRLMSRRVVEALCAMPEQQRFIRGMVSWVGFKQMPLEYDRAECVVGTTKYPLRKMIRFALDAITSFSIAPLRLASHLGLATALLALVVLAYSLYRWLVGGVVTGWTSLIGTVLLLGSVQLVVLGIMGEYLGRLLIEAKRRPLFLVDVVTMQRRSIGLPAHFATLSGTEQQELWGRLAGGGAAVPPLPEPVIVRRRAPRNRVPATAPAEQR